MFEKRINSKNLIEGRFRKLVKAVNMHLRLQRIGSNLYFRYGR